MRPKYHRFEDLVSENKKELMDDEKLLRQLEIRLDKKQTEEEPEKKNRITYRKKMF